MSDLLTYSNPQVQRLRRLLGRRSSRSSDGAFVVEGATLLGQAVDAGWQIEAQYVAPGGTAIACEAPVQHLGPNVIERVASTQHPQPLLAVVRTRTVPMPPTASFVVVGDRLGDPGNAGTIIRSAEAAGADGVVLTPGSVDVFNPKVVRASAGSLFRLPVVEGTLDDVRSMGVRLLGTSSHQGEVYTDIDLRQPVALVLGNEAHGVPADAAMDGWITIPSGGELESLNVAMAAAVVCFEVARQRRG